MYRIRGTIEGVAPILFSRWVTDLDAPSGGKHTAESRAAEAALKVYRGTDGLLSLPAWNLKKAIADGCARSGLKDGKRSAAGLLLAGLFIDADPTFGVAEPDLIHAATGKRPARTGGAVIIERPALATGWHLVFAASVVLDRIQPDLIRQSVEACGLEVGIGSWRPEYGRFVLRDWALDK